MAVLVEANSVIVRVEALISRFTGGWEAFRKRVPNDTLCTDNELVRVGFMSPEGAKAFIWMLERNGLTHLCDGESIDIAIAVQLRGLVWPCSWLELGHLRLGNDPECAIAGCRLPGSTSTQIATPPGWKFEGSVSQTYGCIPAEVGSQSREISSREGRSDGPRASLTREEAIVGCASELVA